MLKALEYLEIANFSFRLTNTKLIVKTYNLIENSAGNNEIDTLAIIKICKVYEFAEYTLQK